MYGLIIEYQKCIYIATQHGSQLSKTGKYKLLRDEKRRTLALSRAAVAANYNILLSYFAQKVHSTSKRVLQFCVFASGCVNADLIKQSGVC